MYDKMLNSDIMNMTKYCAKQCALMAVEEAKIEIGNYDRTDGYVRTREDFWDAVKSELQSF